ncbi:MAG: hypothetical protein EBX35_03960 [Planctomycetia bacterium]|nr:hypothetical protein [Planctomycetia bacterium]
MTDHTAISVRTPTSYEASQIREIAAWKSSRPSRLARIVDTLTSPVTWAVGHVVPRRFVAGLVSSMESIAARADVQADVARAAGVADVRDLAAASLEDCDRLARLFSARAERFAIVEGAAASLGGPLFHAPQQLIASLRSISRIGHCYGYALTEHFEHGVVIDILELSMIQEERPRITMIESLHEAIDARQDSINDEGDYLERASRTMLAEEALDFIPVVGSAVAFLFDSQFMHAVDETAQRIFQERWLRDRGIVPSISPASIHQRASSYADVGRAIGQGLYCVGAVVGFGVTFPCRLVQHAFGSARNPVGRGARHGSHAAVDDARQFIAGLREGIVEPLGESLAVPRLADQGT